MDIPILQSLMVVLATMIVVAYHLISTDAA
jgi:hypothetical protein